MDGEEAWYIHKVDSVKIQGVRKKRGFTRIGKDEEVAGPFPSQEAAEKVLMKIAWTLPLNYTLELRRKA